MHKIRIELKWGLIIAGCLFLLMCLEFLVGLQKPENLSINIVVDLAFGLVIPIVGFVFGLSQKKRDFFGGTMRYQEGFMTGLTITGVWMLAGVVFLYLFLNLVNPGYLDTLVAESVKNGAFATEEAARAKLNIKTYANQSLFYSLISGFLLSAIISYFLTRTSSNVSI